MQKIKAPGLLDAWRDQSKYDMFGAWVNTEWYGSIKPSTDMLKQAKGSKLLIDEVYENNNDSGLFNADYSVVDLTTHTCDGTDDSAGTDWNMF